MEARPHSQILDAERAVRARYTQGAARREEALCCPVDYDPRYLKAIPQEVIERDYGCGDPSRYVLPGDVVLDLGCGAGKICFIAAQIVGRSGFVIGVDMNDEMIALARSAAPEVAGAIGCVNVSFRRGRIQDLALDLDLLDAWLKKNPVRTARDASDLEEVTSTMRRDHPLVADNAVDLVVSNCVLNLVRPEDKPRLIREIFRVLKPGGRIALSDIVSDEPVPDDLKADPDLWSGCVSGAFHEREILRELESAGFYGVTIDKWTDKPFRTVSGLEFRSVTITARKGKEGPCWEMNQAVIYRGPWKEVTDDDGHLLRRGERAAVCEKTYRILTTEPYASEIIPVPSRVTIPATARRPFDCSRTAPRHPRETKGESFDLTTPEGGACCGGAGDGDGDGGGCCG